MANETAGLTTPENSTRRCQVTDNEKRDLRVLLARQKEVRERKAAARRRIDPRHGTRLAALDAREIAFLKKLCGPAPFAPDGDEALMLRDFESRRIVKIHRNADGSSDVEVTNHGADRYIESEYGPAA